MEETTLHTAEDRDKCNYGIYFSIYLFLFFVVSWLSETSAGYALNAVVNMFYANQCIPMTSCLN